MKQIKLNESALRNIVAESVKRILKEEWDTYFPANEEEEFDRCYTEIDEFLENLTKEYRIETITECLKRLYEFYKGN